MIETITFIVFLAIWPIWFIWEMVLFKLRTTVSPRPKLISHIAKDLGWNCSGVVYLWGGLATHFWWTSESWATIAGTIAFWSIAALLFIEDLVLLVMKKLDKELWPRWLWWQRMPPIILVGGLVCGKLLFAQKG